MIQNLNKIKTLKNKSSSYKLQEEEEKDITYTKILVRFASPNTHNVAGEMSVEATSTCHLA